MTKACPSHVSRSWRSGASHLISGRRHAAIQQTTEAGVATRGCSDALATNLTRAAGLRAATTPEVMHVLRLTTRQRVLALARHLHHRRRPRRPSKTDGHPRRREQFADTSANPRDYRMDPSVRLSTAPPSPPYSLLRAHPCHGVFPLPRRSPRRPVHGVRRTDFCRARCHAQATQITNL